MRHILSALCLLLCALAVAGCGSGGDGAVEVADNFWQAMADHDVHRARTFATAASASTLTIDEDAADQEARYELGTVEDEDGATRIETTLWSYDGDGNEMRMDLETVVVREDGAWKVDANQTFMSMFGGAMEQMMQELGDAMGESMEELGRTMQTEMGDALQELGEAMEKAESGR